MKLKQISYPKDLPVIESTKSFRNYPCAHRRWQHDGHCSLVHGYSRSFHFTFRCREVTKNGFVVDFGSLKKVKAWLADMFDHTLLLDADDPLLRQFKLLEQAGACRLVLLPDVGMEGTAKHVGKHVDAMVKQMTEGRAWVHSVEVRENDKNSARATWGQ